MEIPALTVGSTRNDHRVDVPLNDAAVWPCNSHRLEMITDSLSIGTSIQHSLGRRPRSRHDLRYTQLGLRCLHCRSLQEDAIERVFLRDGAPSK